MFFSNLLIAGLAGVATVSARAIGDILPSSKSTSHQCTFLPYDHLSPSISQRPLDIPPTSYTNIPPHAWSHISTLLLTNSPSSIAQNSVQTHRLSSVCSDVTLESVVLGLVFTTPEQGHELELRSLIGNEEERERTCLEEAVRAVESERLVEGVLEMDGRGKVGFLVYRTD